MVENNQSAVVEEERYLIRKTQINTIGTKGKAYTTSIPAAIRELFNIQADDTVRWFVNATTGRIELEIYSGLASKGPLLTKRKLTTNTMIRLAALTEKVKELKKSGTYNPVEFEEITQMMLNTFVKEMTEATDYIGKLYPRPPKKKSTS